MKYSIVVPVYLREPTHKQVVIDTLDNLRVNSNDCELIIVDDGSTEMTGFLKNYADVLVRQPNLGISRSWNVGMFLARGEYTVICNDDIKVPSGWLDTLSSAFEKKRTGVSAPQAGGPHIEPSFEPKTIYPDHKFYPGYCFMLKKDRFYEPFDERFISNCGDTDYWHRVRNADLYCMRVGLRVWHKEGGVLHGMDYEKISTSSIEKFKEKWGFNPQKEYYG